MCRPVFTGRCFVYKNVTLEMLYKMELYEPKEKMTGTFL
jgi:hypothetical protein